MMRKLILLSALFVSVSMTSMAQFCGVDKATQQLLIEHPEFKDRIEANKQVMEAQIAEGYKKLNIAKLAKTTSTFGVDSFVIPVAVHVIHNYGTEDVSDADIYTMISNLNMYYNERNTDISGVIAPFVRYIGNMHIGFHLATVDPNGQPTKGVTRRYSYLTYGGDNYAKFDLWDPSAYLNIWVESYIGLGAEVKGSIVAAYSQLPDVGAVDPFIDGLITGSSFIADGSTAYVISHEVGHYLGLLHPFGSNNFGTFQGGGCGDDGVDDTPPTSGEFDQPCTKLDGNGHLLPIGLYDTQCATGYVKSYPSVLHPTQDSIWNYPDTANTQNIMTYSQCIPELMFTIGQTYRTHAVMTATLANRDSLSTPFNLANTGALNPLPPLPPVADFTVNNHFVCANETSAPITFTSHSWNDTIASLNWTLPSYASTSSSTATSFSSSFSQPGWVTISLKATGVHNHGSDTRVDSTLVYVADNVNVTNPTGYYEEFNTSLNNDVNKYPTFNYYNNEFKWILNTNTGYNDNACMEYVGFDSRTYPANQIGEPKGDYDDMFTPVFDLSGLTGSGNTPTLNFMYSAATLSANAADMNDTLEIDYNTGCAAAWVPLTYLTKTALVNKGTYGSPYRPLWAGDWSLQSIPLQATGKNAISKNTTFRFRYKPGVNAAFYANTAAPVSTGNNFYLDRLNFSNYPLGLNTLMTNDKSVVVTPNPTNGDAVVLVSTTNDVNVHVQITDIAGRVVYTTAQQTTGSLTSITIPRSAISVKGMYLVHVLAGEQNQTEKLVVY